MKSQIEFLIYFKPIIGCIFTILGGVAGANNNPLGVILLAGLAGLLLGPLIVFRGDDT